MKHRGSSLLLLASLIVAACGSPAGKATKPAARTEADNLAQSFWETQFSKCGDSYVMTRGTDTYQILGARFEARGLVLSEADRLNGREWAGTFVVLASSKRNLTPRNFAGRPGPPEEWSNIDNPWDLLTVEAQKVRGAWWVGTGSELKSSGWYTKLEPIEGASFNGGGQLASGDKVPCDSVPPR